MSVPTPPVVRPEVREDTPPPVVDPGPESVELALFYRRLQNDYLVQGLLRRDGGGPDTPFNERQLADNFIRIGLFDEYRADGGQLIAAPTEANLRRWERPVRFGVEFGASVPREQREKDRATVSAYVDRLSRITGHPMSMAANPNFHVLVLNEADRRGSADWLREIAPDISNASLRAVLNMPRSTLCLVLAFADGRREGYSRAIAVVRGEHPDLMRLSCFHEELAQGLGLANDSPRARPSIFNDDEEFGLLTTHDELLLKMLYDERLRVGMNAVEAAPIVKEIAAELVGGPV